MFNKFIINFNIVINLHFITAMPDLIIIYAIILLVINLLTYYNYHILCLILILLTYHNYK